uniref:Heparanase 2 (inactive) n=1 Tax=Ailuropoda melanoleuca TaxID=9646 RepID=G1L064_AILME
MLILKLQAFFCFFPARSLDKLYNFADCSGLHLIFALNALRRNPNNSWNSSSALSLLKYSASKKYNISWELGNEPNNYRTMHGRAVNGSQLGKDYIQLKSLLQPIRIYSRASLYGPNIGRPRKNVIALLDGFMKVAGSTVDAVTWQHCYIDGRVVKVMDFLKTRLLDTLSDQIRKIQKVVNTYTPGKKIWLEGVVTTSAGGTNNLSDSYAAGFLWLNTLGMLANQGIDVVIRHSFFDHGYNHLVDQNFNPLPKSANTPTVGDFRSPGKRTFSSAVLRHRLPPLSPDPPAIGKEGTCESPQPVSQSGAPLGPQLCSRVHYTFYHQPAPIKKENQTGWDSQGQARAPVSAAALWTGGAQVQVSAAERPALSDGGRWDPPRTEAPPPAGRPDTGHPSSHHGLLCGQECQRFGLPLPINHPHTRESPAGLLDCFPLSRPNSILIFQTSS